MKPVLAVRSSAPARWRWRGLVLAAAATLAPSLALACPVCAQGDSPNAALLIGAMIAAPYVVAALVIRAIRAAGDDR